MTVREFENKCAILAQTPQERWFDLRLKAFVTMIQNFDFRILNIADLFPVAKVLNLGVYCIKVENRYYFFIPNRTGETTNFFNVEFMDFSNPYDYILSSHIILSSDDDSNRVTFLPSLMMKMTRSELKTKLDVLFSK